MAKAEISVAQIAAQFDRSRQLTAGILAAIGPSGRNYARRHVQRYSPEAIRDVVKTESSSTLFTSLEAKCWKKYSDLSTELNETTIETEIQDATAGVNGPTQGNAVRIAALLVREPETRRAGNIADIIGAGGDGGQEQRS